MREKLGPRGRKLVLALLATGALVGVLGLAGSASAQSGVPDGFEPRHSSWTSTERGHVVGQAFCDGNDVCPYLLSTEDAGQTWTERPLPDLGPDWEVSELYAAGDDPAAQTRLLPVIHNGDTSALWASYDGETWQDEDFGLDKEFWIDDVRTIGSDAYVVLGMAIKGGTDFRTEVYRSPVGTDEWTKVPSLTQDGSGYAAQLDTRDQSAILWNGIDYSRSSLATTTDGAQWTTREQPCQDPELPWVGQGTAETSFVLCDGDPARLLASTDAGATFTQRGEVELSGGIVTDIATYDDNIVVGNETGAADGGGCFVEASFDGGRTWQHTLEVPGDLALTDMTFTDANTVTALCADPSNLGTPGTDVYRTTDGGRTWTPLGLNT